MNLELNDVKNTIRNAVKQYTRIQVENDNKNLLSTEYVTNLVDFMYVIKELEDVYGSFVYKIFEKYDYTVFTANNLAQAIVTEYAAIASREENMPQQSTTP